MKQLYASHYFDAWLDVAALIEQSAPAPRTYVVLVRRVRFDHLPNRGLFDIRGRIVRKVRDELRDELGRAKQMTSSPTAAPIMTSQQFLEHWQGHRALTRRVSAQPVSGLLEASSIASSAAWGDGSTSRRVGKTTLA